MTSESTIFTTYHKRFDEINDELQSSFHYVEPCFDNVKTYSHKFRDIIIQADDLLEDLMNELCKEHVTNPSEFTPCMKNFTDIIPTHYPQIENLTVTILDTEFQIAPFENWSITHKLQWWKVAISLKHNPDKHLEIATLENTLLIVCAVSILLEVYSSLPAKQNQ